MFKKSNLIAVIFFFSTYFHNTFENDFFFKLNKFNSWNITSSSRTCNDSICMEKESFDQIKEFIKKKLYNDDKWANYRLGDVVILNPKRKKKMWDPNYYDNILYHQTHYPGSIAEEYIHSLKKSPRRNTTKLISEIIEKRRKNLVQTTEDVLYLHIRVCDIICSKFSWISNAAFQYSKKGNEIWWSNLVEYILKSKVNLIIILAGCHLNECVVESAEYILDRTIFLIEKTKLPIKYELGNSPDNDLILCSNAKRFLSTGGHFGQLLQILSQCLDCNPSLKNFGVIDVIK